MTGERRVGALELDDRLERIETKLDESLAQISIERHRVNNILHGQGLVTELLARIKDQEIRIKTLEDSELKEKAVDDFKKNLKLALIGGSLLGTFVAVLQIIVLFNQVN